MGVWGEEGVSPLREDSFAMCVLWAWLMGMGMGRRWLGE